MTLLLIRSKLLVMKAASVVPSPFVATTLQVMLAQDLPPLPLDIERSTVRSLQAPTCVGRMITTTGSRASKGGCTTLLGPTERDREYSREGKRALCNAINTMLLSHLVCVRHAALNSPPITFTVSPASGPWTSPPTESKVALTTEGDVHALKGKSG